jgi:hypothetical protein
MLLLAPMLLQVFLLWLALLLLALLQHYVLAVAFFPAPMPEKSSGLFGSLEGDLLHSQCRESFLVPRVGPFTIPNARKIWSLEPGQVFLQGPDFYGMEACKMSHSWDRKTFQTSGNEKGLLAGTRKFF